MVYIVFLLFRVALGMAELLEQFAQVHGACLSSVEPMMTSEFHSSMLKGFLLCLFLHQNTGRNECTYDTVCE